MSDRQPRGLRLLMVGGKVVVAAVAGAAAAQADAYEP